MGLTLLNSEAVAYGLALELLEVLLVAMLFVSTSCFWACSKLFLSFDISSSMFFRYVASSCASLWKILTSKEIGLP